MSSQYEIDIAIQQVFCHAVYAWMRIVDLLQSPVNAQNGDITTLLLFVLMYCLFNFVQVKQRNTGFCFSRRDRHLFE